MSQPANFQFLNGDINERNADERYRALLYPADCEMDASASCGFVVFRNRKRRRKARLHVLGWTWADYAQKAFVEPFEKETGIKVEVRAHQNTMDRLAKLQAVRNNLDVDVWATSPVPAAGALSQGVGAKFDPTRGANAAKLPKELITPACIAWYRFFFGIVYDQKKVPFEITKWTDLLDPRLKGQIAVPNASNGEGKFLIQLAWLSGGSENNIEPGFEMAKKLRMPASTTIRTRNGTRRLPPARSRLAPCPSSASI